MFVTPREREAFKESGFLIVDPDLPHAVLDGVISDLSGTYSGSEPIDVPYHDPRRVQDAWRISQNVKTLAVAPKILGILKELYGRKPQAFQTLNFPVGTEQLVHSDTVHFNSMPSGYMCGVWVALEDIDMENGPLVYYPGSHKFAEITVEHLAKRILSEQGVLSRFLVSVLPNAPVFYRFGFWSRHLRSKKTEEIYAYYERFIAEAIQRDSLKPSYGILKKGQALIWSSNLLHGGAPQKDKRRSRHSQVTHYFFEGCRYYTPVLSFGKSIHWRNPDWIG